MNSDTKLEELKKQQEQIQEQMIAMHNASTISPMDKSTLLEYYQQKNKELQEQIDLLK